MASVQELLLAAQAKQGKHPLSALAELVNAAGQGYKEGSDIRNVRSEADLRRAEVLKTIIQTQQQQQEIEAQKKLRDQFEQQLAVTEEQRVRAGQAATGAAPPPTTPAAKFETEWKQDEKGNISRSIKQVSPKPADIPQGYRVRPDGSMEFIPGGPADPAVKSSLNKAPNGFRYDAAGDLEAIPGGPADIKAQQDKAKSDLALANQTDKAKNISTSIDGALEKVNNWSAGAGATLKGIPLTQAKGLAVDLQHIKSMLGIDQLTEMKAQSKTGASGFGQLSDRELDVITSSVANLDQAQDPEQLKKSLGDIKTHYANWLELQKGSNPYDAGGAGKETPAQRKARLIKELQGATNGAH